MDSRFSVFVLCEGECLSHRDDSVPVIIGIHRNPESVLSVDCRSPVVDEFIIRYVCAYHVNFHILYTPRLSHILFCPSHQRNLRHSIAPVRCLL